jgi:hypothetical protein
MRQNIREYSYAGLIAATPILVLIGLALLWTAVSVEAHLTAFIFLALAGCSYVGAQELKLKGPPPDVQPAPEFFERKEPQ